MEESFGTITEFAVALAGFSAVSIALSRNPGDMAPLDRFRALNILSCSLGSAFGSTFVPMGAAYGVSGPALWRGTSLGVLLVVIVCIAIPLSLTRRLSSTDRGRLSATLWVLLIGGNVVLTGLLLSNITGWFGAQGPGPIMVSLVWPLFFSALLFVRILVNRPDQVGAQE